MASREWLEYVIQQRDADVAASTSRAASVWGTGDDGGRVAHDAAGPSPPVEASPPPRRSEVTAMKGGASLVASSSPSPAARGGGVKDSNAAAAAADGTGSGDEAGELADALESLRVARKEHERLARQVAKAKRDFEPAARIDAKGLRGGGGEVSRLRTHIGELASLLERGEAAAEATNHRVRNHVAAVKSEVDGLKMQVQRLHEAVDVAEARCTDAAQEVKQLRDTLREVTTGRDEFSARLSKLIVDTRHAMRQLDADMVTKDRELERLGEQNAYFHLQLMQRH
jgi:hypothetical protein